MPSALRARDPQAAAHSSRLILLVCAAVVAGLTVYQQSGADGVTLVVHWLGVAGLVVAALACTCAPRDARPARLSPVVAVAAVVLICTLNL